MSKTYGARDIVRNPSLLRIGPGETIIIEDKKSHKQLGLYIGVALAEEFEAYRRRCRLMDAAHKIKAQAAEESSELEGSIGDGL